MNNLPSRANEILLPDDSPLRQTMPYADFEDAFFRCLPNLSVATRPVDLIGQMESKIPAYLVSVMKLKNALFLSFGFSPVTLENFFWTDIEPNHRVGEFKDKFFTAHVGISIDHSKRGIILASRVTFHHRRGSTYMIFAKPFHKATFKFLLNLL